MIHSIYNLKLMFLRNIIIKMMNLFGFEFINLLIRERFFYDNVFNLVYKIHNKPDLNILIFDFNFNGKINAKIIYNETKTMKN